MASLIPFVPKSDPPLDVEAAKVAMEKERAEVAAHVGLRFVVIRCVTPGCTFEAEGCGVNDGSATGKAITQLAAHVVNEHYPSVTKPHSGILDYGRPEAS